MKEKKGGIAKNRKKFFRREGSRPRSSMPSESKSDLQERVDFVSFGKQESPTSTSPSPPPKSAYLESVKTPHRFKKDGTRLEGGQEECFVVDMVHDKDGEVIRIGYSPFPQNGQEVVLRSGLDSLPSFLFPFSLMGALSTCRFSTTWYLLLLLLLGAVSYLQKRMKDKGVEEKRARYILLLLLLYIFLQMGRIKLLTDAQRRFTTFAYFCDKTPHVHTKGQRIVLESPGNRSEWTVRNTPCIQFMEETCYGKKNCKK